MTDETANAPLVSDWGSSARAAPEMRALLAKFVASLHERAGVLEGTLVEGDVEALVVIAHQLKGTAGAFGFPTISEVAADLEVKANAGQSSSALADHVRSLVDLCRRAETGDGAT